MYGNRDEQAMGLPMDLKDYPGGDRHRRARHMVRRAALVRRAAIAIVVVMLAYAVVDRVERACGCDKPQKPVAKKVIA